MYIVVFVDAGNQPHRWPELISSATKWWFRGHVDPSCVGSLGEMLPEHPATLDGWSVCSVCEGQYGMEVVSQEDVGRSPLNPEKDILQQKHPSKFKIQ